MAFLTESHGTPLPLVALIFFSIGCNDVLIFPAFAFKATGLRKEASPANHSGDAVTHTKLFRAARETKGKPLVFSVVCFFHLLFFFLGGAGIR